MEENESLSSEYLGIRTVSEKLIVIINEYFGVYSLMKFPTTYHYLLS